MRSGSGSLTGPSPADRGKKGSKIHVPSEANGIPLGHTRRDHVGRAGW